MGFEEKAPDLLLDNADDEEGFLSSALHTMMFCWFPSGMDESRFADIHFWYTAVNFTHWPLDGYLVELTCNMQDPDEKQPPIVLRAFLNPSDKDDRWTLHSMWSNLWINAKFYSKKSSTYIGTKRIILLEEDRQEILQVLAEAEGVSTKWPAIKETYKRMYPINQRRINKDS